MTPRKYILLLRRGLQELLHAALDRRSIVLGSECAVLPLLHWRTFVKILCVFSLLCLFNLRNSSIIPLCCCAHELMYPLVILVFFNFGEMLDTSILLSYLEQLPSCLRLECFGYLSIQDLGRIARVKSSFNRELCNDYVWRSVYPQTFGGAKDAIPQEIQNLVNRPYRRSCIGWTVSVLQTGTNTWLTGTLIDYRNELFLIRYDLDDSEVWERETTTGGAWFTAGKLRIRFLTSPSHDAPPRSLKLEELVPLTHG